MSERLLLAVPSKGRLMEQSVEFFKKAGIPLKRLGSERGYHGEIAGVENLEVTFVSA